MTESEYFQSKEFQDRYENRVTTETWKIGLPKFYINDVGQLVEHWAEGTINIIKEKTNDI